MKDLANFLFELGTLRYLKRSYQINLMEDTESVAEHLHRTVAIAYFLAQATGANIQKVVVMAEFHDMAETRTGDEIGCKNRTFLKKKTKLKSFNFSHWAKFQMSWQNSS